MTKTNLKIAIISTVFCLNLTYLLWKKFNWFNSWRLVNSPLGFITICNIKATKSVTYSRCFIHARKFCCTTLSILIFDQVSCVPCFHEIHFTYLKHPLHSRCNNILHFIVTTTFSYNNCTLIPAPLYRFNCT